MAEEETYSEKISHETAIALIRKDIGYITSSIGKIETAIMMMDRNYTKREEFTSMVELIKDIAKKLEKKADHEDMKIINTALEKKADHEDIKKINEALKEKVDHKDFDPIQKILGRINWILIAGFVTAILSLVVNASKT